MRIANDVGQQAVALEPFRKIRNALGMEEHQAIVRYWERGPFARLCGLRNAGAPRRRVDQLAWTSARDAWGKIQESHDVYSPTLARLY
jgi:hypothetical protein